jgi:tetratricopeptide (TPR) repeat protein
MASRTHDARLELFAGMLLNQFGGYAEALQYLQQAVADSPKKQQILIQLALLQMQQGSTIDAIATARTAYEEAPDYDFARIIYATSYYYAGDTTSGDKLLIDKWGSTIVDNDQLLQIYMSLKLYARAEAIWQLRIDKSPSNVQLYLGLASAYFQAGDKTNTIATLKKAEKASPADAAQIESIITQINNGTLKPGAA